MPQQPRKRHARNHNSNMHRHEVRSQYIVGNNLASCLHLSPNLWFTTQCCYGASFSPVDALRKLHLLGPARPQYHGVTGRSTRS